MAFFNLKEKIKQLIGDTERNQVQARWDNDD